MPLLRRLSVFITTFSTGAALVTNTKQGRPKRHLTASRSSISTSKLSRSRYTSLTSPCPTFSRMLLLVALLATQLMEPLFFIVFPPFLVHPKNVMLPLLSSVFELLGHKFFVFFRSRTQRATRLFLPQYIFRRPSPFGSAPHRPKTTPQLFIGLSGLSVTRQTPSIGHLVSISTNRSLSTMIWCALGSMWI